MFHLLALHRKKYLVISLLLFTVLALWPVNRKIYNLILMFIGVDLLIAISLYLRKPFKSVYIGMTILIAVILFLPVREIKQNRLHGFYIEQLKSYENRRYVWGGENLLGIDCSGLPRKAIRMALCQEANEGVNPGLMRLAFSHWWHDASAKALAEGYRSYLVPLGVAGSAKLIDKSLLQAGDLGITTNGVHVLIYMGGNDWVQADPVLGQVKTFNSQRDENLWFDDDVEMFRWAELMP